MMEIIIFWTIGRADETTLLTQVNQVGLTLKKVGSLPSKLRKLVLSIDGNIRHKNGAEHLEKVLCFLVRRFA